uniref:Uncharacterized protein n=1 Tax=Oryza glumipatula TaxID=40148 RepID=A0A0D9Z9S4_9ORYZ
MSGHWCHRPISLTGASQAKPLRHQLRLAEVVPFFLFSLSFSHCHKHYRHHHSRPELSSCCRRFGHPLFSLCLPPTSPDVQRAGTRLTAAVEAVQPPKHRCPVPLPLCCCSGEETEERREEREEEEETYDKWAPLHNRTASFISIQGADVDPDGYAEAAGNLKAQGKT